MAEIGQLLLRKLSFTTFERLIGKTININIELT